MPSTLHDDRERGWFHMDNAVVDVYLPLVGHTAFAVYAFLVRSVSHERGYAFPSYTKMQRGLGIGRNQVAESLKRLTDHGLIRVDKGDAAAVNHYFIASVGSLAQKLVSPQNQSRPETETSFQEKPKLVSERDSKKTYLKRPTEKESPPMGESERQPPRTHARTRFSPAHPQLTDPELGEDAATVGVTPEEYAAHLPQWSDSRLSSGARSADWRADARKFIRAAEQIDQRARAPTNGRASPPVTFAQQQQANNDRASEEFLAIMEGVQRGSPAVQQPNGPPRRGLPD